MYVIEVIFAIIILVFGPFVLVTPFLLLYSIGNKLNKKVVIVILCIVYIFFDLIMMHVKNFPIHF